MSEDFKVTVNFAGLQTALTKMPKLLAKNLRKAFVNIGAYWQKKMVKERLSGIPLRRRTGQLARSMKYHVEGSTDENTIKDAKVILGSSCLYAPIHEYGGVIKPKNSKFLAIPLPAAQTPSGVARVTPRELQNSIVIKGKGGKLIIAELLGKANTKSGLKKTGVMMKYKLVPMFLLLKQVTIRPSLGATQMAKDDMNIYCHFINDGIDEALKEIK